MLQYQTSPRKLTNCFSCVANGYLWRQASCVNEIQRKIDRVYDADSLEQCYDIWRSKQLQIEGLASYDYVHNKDKKDIIIERRCEREGDQMLITISNQAWFGWTYYKPELYVRGLVDGKGVMVDHRNGFRYWWDMSILKYS